MKLKARYIVCLPACRLSLRQLEQVYSAEDYRDNRADAVYYRDGSCASQIHQDEGIFYPKGFWPVDNARRLAQEVADILLPRLQHRHRGRIFVRELEAATTQAGCSLISEVDKIFIQLHRVENPLQLVSTVIHELAHITAFDIGHLDESCGHHCVVWLEAARMLTSAFIGCMVERSREPASGLVDMLAYQTGLGGWFRRLPITQGICIDCQPYKDAKQRLDDQERQGSTLGTTNEVTWEQISSMCFKHTESASILQARAGYKLLQEGAELVTEDTLVYAVDTDSDSETD